MKSATAEYLDGNGNGHNGHNGHNGQKVFELARPKTEAEIARDAVRKMMPEIRRRVSMRKIIAQAKWLFAQISDDSFMNDFGGDGFGTLCTSIKDLASRYGHDRDSVSKWLNILADEEVIWWTAHWPLMQIRIAAVVPAPARQASAFQKARARYLVASRETHAEDTRTALFLAQNGESTDNAEGAGTINGQEPPHHTVDSHVPCPQEPHTMRKIPAQNGGQLPHGMPTTPGGCAEDTRIVRPHLPHGVPAPSVSHVEQQPEKSGENGSLEVPPKNGKKTFKGPEGRNGSLRSKSEGGRKIEARSARKEGKNEEAQIVSASALKAEHQARWDEVREAADHNATAPHSTPLRSVSGDDELLSIAKQKLENIPECLTDSNVKVLIAGKVALPKEISQKFKHLVVPALRGHIKKFTRGNDATGRSEKEILT